MDNTTPNMNQTPFSTPAPTPAPTSAPSTQTPTPVSKTNTIWVLVVLLVLAVIFWRWSLGYKPDALIQKIDSDSAMGQPSASDQQASVIASDEELNAQIDASLQSSSELEMKAIDTEF